MKVTKIVRIKVRQVKILTNIELTVIFKVKSHEKVGV